MFFAETHIKMGSLFSRPVDNIQNIKNLPPKPSSSLVLSELERSNVTDIRQSPPNAVRQIDFLPTMSSLHRSTGQRSQRSQLFAEQPLLTLKSIDRPPPFNTSSEVFDEAPTTRQCFLQKSQYQVCWFGGPWPREATHGYCFSDDLVLQVYFRNDPSAPCIDFNPRCSREKAFDAIGIDLVRDIERWQVEYPTNYSFYPHSSNEEYDWEEMERAPTTMRSEKEQKEIANWMLRGLVAIREVHRRLFIKLRSEEWKKEFGLEAIRVCWELPAFMDPEEEGWSEYCWLPLNGPFLTQYEMIEGDCVPLEETRVFKVIAAHHPDVAETVLSLLVAG